MCHPFFLAQAQMQGQQCFLSAKRSLAHLISAMMLAPCVSKAAAQALTVIQTSTAHSTTSYSVQSVVKIAGISAFSVSMVSCAASGSLTGLQVARSTLAATRIDTTTARVLAIGDKISDKYYIQKGVYFYLQISILSNVVQIFYFIVQRSKCYNFWKTNMTKDQNLKKINARVMKWREMLKKGLYSDKELLVKRVRKGIPSSIRQQIWPEMIKVQKIIEKSILTYSTLLLKDSYDTYDINLDIPRTFSFQSQQVLRSSLFNVLKSLSVQFPLVGYCQGMNFLCMRLLQVLNDETVFYLLAFLIKKYRSLYDNFRNPGFVNRMNQVFSVLFQRHMPKLYERLKEQYIQPVMYTTSWFLTLFSKTLQKEKFYRFFQCLLVEGYVVIYKASLALMKLKQKQIFKNQMEQNLLFVSDFQFYETFTDDQFIKAIFTFEVNLEQVLQLQKDYSYINKSTLKSLQESVQKAYNKKKQEPRTVIEWNLEDFKKSKFEYVNFQ